MEQFNSSVRHQQTGQDGLKDSKEDQTPSCSDMGHLDDSRDQTSVKSMDKNKGPPPLFGSCRLSVAFMIFLGNCNMYMMRVNVSVAIVCMVNQTEISEEIIHNVNETFGYKGNGTLKEKKPLCSVRNDIIDTGSEDEEFSWDKATQGQILSSFFVGYICTQIVGGLLSTKFGGRRVYGWSMLICAILAMLTPVAARTHVYLFIGLRFLTGLCQGVAYPAQQSLFAMWSPSSERSRLGSFGYAGGYVGYVMAFPIAALLCEFGFDGGWPSIFYVCGAIGTVWFIAWMYFVYDTPYLHPRISKEEKSYITGHLEEDDSGHKQVVPWLSLLTSRPVWAIVFAHVCCNWGDYTFATNIPTYMKEVLKFDIKTNGFLSALPYIGLSVLTNLSGIMADYLRQRKLLNTNQVRKLFQTTGFILPATFVIGTGFMDCQNSANAVILLTLGITTMGCQYGSGFMINPLDIAPNFAGIILGISNTFATLPGLIAPNVISELTQNKTREEWQAVFYITAAIYVAGAVVYVTFGSGYLQNWVHMEENKDIDLSKTSGIEYIS